jgi:hypothetical protein
MEPGMGKSGAGKNKSAKWTQYKRVPDELKPTWEEADKALLLQAIVEITSDGDAILLGSTRDGGSLVLTICSGDERIKFYMRTPEEIDSQLRELISQAQS